MLSAKDGMSSYFTETIRTTFLMFSPTITTCMWAWLGTTETVAFWPNKGQAVVCSSGTLLTNLWRVSTATATTCLTSTGCASQCTCPTFSSTQPCRGCLSIVRKLRTGLAESRTKSLIRRPSADSNLSLKTKKTYLAKLDMTQRKTSNFGASHTMKLAWPGSRLESTVLLELIMG